jgi:TatD DNase family protein
MLGNDHPSLFDTHVHLDAFSPLEEALTPARAAGIGRFLVPGVAPEGWERLLALADPTAGIWAAPGVHPQSADQWSTETEQRLQRLLDDPKVAAVGEIGLDRLLPQPSQKLQEQAFRGQLRLARAARLPVLIHCRRAWRRTLDILSEEGAQECGGILHAFSGSLETALEGIGLGFVIAFGGPLTYPNARRSLEVLKSLPAEAVVLETDAPDLPPHPHRGERNWPEYLSLIAAKVAEARGWTLEETARITTANALRVLTRIPGKDKP